MQSLVSMARGASRVIRYILLSAIVVIAALTLSSPDARQAVNPLRIGTAQASGSICAAPNCLALTAGASGKDKFFIIDSNRKVICVYQVLISEIRLVAARKYDEDERIWDGSLPLVRNKRLEGGEGFTRNEARDYADALQKFLDSGKSKP